ncbi:MAG: hypothetical protein DHS20C16_16480 [Phycisphaerae bacterium]|nr:MAG: hypothetical protein DHS20C16_16480 [Phycisphaerae bacterium]
MHQAAVIDFFARKICCPGDLSLHSNDTCQPLTSAGLRQAGDRHNRVSQTGGTSRLAIHRIGKILALLISCNGIFAIAGCASLFNPSFLSLVTTPTPDATGIVNDVTLANAPGHVPVFLINNTRFDSPLIDYMESLGIDTSDPDLRPRVRVRTTINYVNGNSNTIEFLDGSDIVQGTVLTDEGLQENPLIPRQLTDNTLTSIVGVCNIATVQPDASIEVFVPVFLKVIGFESTNILFNVRSLNETIPPRFTILQRDDVDANFNVTLQRNFDIRDVPVPASGVQCGSVVAFILSGTLRVPFVVDELGQTAPGYLDFDDAAQASNPGRFEFQTTVR